MSEILLSIIIPTYNQSMALDLTLYWLTMSMPDKSEIIVIDDMSEEDIPSIVNKYRSKIPVTCYRNKIKGRAAARNLGINLSKGNRILFNDSDRFPADTDLTPHRDGDGVIIGKIMEFYFSQPTKMIDVLKHDFINMKQKSRMPEYPRLIRNYLFDENGVQVSNVPWLGFLSGHVSAPRQALIEVGKYDKNFVNWGVEHFELGYRLALAGLNFFQTHSENYHIAHPRPNNFYHRRLIESFDYFKKKHNAPVINVFEKFIFGISSLQEVEYATTDNCEARKWTEKVTKPIMMKLL